MFGGHQSDVLPNLICREFGFFEVKFGSINVVKLRINSANAVRCLVLCNLSMLIKYYDTFMELVPFQICFFLFFFIQTPVLIKIRLNSHSDQILVYFQSGILVDCAVFN